MTFLLDEIALATARLAEAGVPSPRTDAEEIAAFVHGVRRSALHTVKDADFDALFWEGVARREAREPLQHITGHAYFRYLELAVGPGVFVPRPETEVVAGWAIERLREMDVAEPLVVDLGTGSGAIALSIAQEVALAQVHAVEVDPDAYGWAKRNIAEHGQGRVHLHPEDLADALPELNGKVDLVISNPPYIPPGAVPRDPEVRDYDPSRALYGSGADGLNEVRAVERTARRLLRRGGLVAVEHADEQGQSVYRLFPEDKGWRDARLRQDLTRRDRFVTAKFGQE
ncbi:peptide chain release factor N(5)-glutamine methyltransferase [Nonomuraea sp. NPDC049152]|uniref:peptide chain release factor N(5)-glutamine methyltransferase n=1 Tax=Nonomuraea sp. NPDC049152 TaxID=3154350 RepID=UPI0033C6D0E3